MSEKIKACRDCVFSRGAVMQGPDKWKYAQCVHEKGIFSLEPAYHLGQETSPGLESRYCATMRSVGSPCGPHARLFSTSAGISDAK